MTSEVGSDSQRTLRVLMLVPTSFFTDYGCHVSILEEARMPHFLGGRCRLGENQWEDRRRRKPRCAISIAWIYLYASPCPWFGLEARTSAKLWFPARSSIFREDHGLHNNNGRAAHEDLYNNAFL